MASQYDVCISCNNIVPQKDTNIFQTKVESTLEILSQYKCSGDIDFEYIKEDIDYLIVKRGLTPAHAVLAVTWVDVKHFWEDFNFQDLSTDIQLQILNILASRTQNSNKTGIAYVDNILYPQNDIFPYIRNLVIALSMPKIINQTYVADFEDCGSSANFASFKCIIFTKPPTLKNLAAHVCTKYMIKSKLKEMLPSDIFDIID